MTQLPRRRSGRAPIDPDMDDGDYNEPPWDTDDEEEEQPRRSRDREPRRSRDERRGKERASESRSERRPSRRRDEDEEPRRPARSREREDRKPDVSRGKGWDTFKDQRAKKAAGAAHRLQVKDKEVVIHFLDAEPFAVYEQHWVGQRTYTCPDEGRCPLCDEGYDTRTLALFNVVDMKTGENMYWEAGPNAAKKIHAASEKKSSSPLDREDLYFAVNREKQSNGFFDFSLDAVKERDLEEDYGLEALSDDELDDALKELFDSSVIPYTDTRTLKAVAAGADDDD